MGILEKVKELLGIKEVPKERVSVEPVSVYVPKLSSLQSRFIDPRYPRDFLPELEKLILTNPDLAHAHQIFLDLSATDLDIFVDTEEGREEIERLNEKINFENLSRLLLSQLIINGAISLEWIVKEDLSGIEKAVRVPVSTIYFVYDEETDEFQPYQYVPPKDPIKLNPATYKYYPLLTLDGSPYGIPPFVAVFSTVEIQQAVMDNLKAFAEKMGLIGFVDISIPPPQRLPGETEIEYQKRLKEYLEENAELFKEQIQKGIALHYDSTKVEYKEIAGITTSRELIDLVEQWMVSASKMQPSLLGRTTGSTETWATIAYEQFVRQLKNMQNLCKEALEYGLKLHLLLAGVSFSELEVRFSPPPSLSPEKDAQAKKLEADRIVELIGANLLTEEEARKELGYDTNEVDD